MRSFYSHPSSCRDTINSSLTKIIVLHDLQQAAANEHFQAIPFLLGQEMNQHNGRFLPINYIMFHRHPIPKSNQLLYMLAKLCLLVQADFSKKLNETKKKTGKQRHTSVIITPYCALWRAKSLFLSISSALFFVRSGVDVFNKSSTIFSAFNATFR